MARIKGLLFFGAAIAVMVVLFYLYMPLGYDWTHTFSKVWVNFQSPFKIEGFTNPPWVIFLLPHAALPLKLGNAVNATINILVLFLIVRKMGGGIFQYLIIFINPLFFDLMRTNNIDWLPGLAFLLPLGWWQLPMIVLKPQSIGLIAFDWVCELYTSRRKVLVISLFVCLAIGLSSFVIWPGWIWDVKRDLGGTSWNFAPFPLGIPLGIYLIYRYWKEKDKILLAVATVCFTPYVAAYSLVLPMALLTGPKYRKVLTFIWIFVWWYVVVEIRRVSS